MNDVGSNTAPVIGGDASVTITVLENTAGNIGSAFSATDADTGDTITWSVGGTDDSSFDISGGQLSLASGVSLDYEDKTSYAITVIASDGTDSDSVAVTVSVTDVTEKPGQPDAPTVTPTSGSTTSLDVSWTAPANTGRPAITAYGVQYRLKDAASWSSANVTVTGTSATITGLTDGAEYEVQVRATNSDGDGPWSASGAGTTGTTTDYDADDDGLIELASVAQLGAIRWDLDGDGTPSTGNETTYAAAFPTPASGMGCASTCEGYELTADLNLSSVANWPVSSSGYTAVFEGNGHVLSNLKQDRAATNVGLFSLVGSGGVIRNVGLVDVNVRGTDNGVNAALGALAGRNEGTIVASYVNGGSVDQVVRQSGGLVGVNTGAITASYARGVTVTDGTAQGGLVGENTGTITASYSTGAVQGTTNSSGLVHVNSGTVTNSYWDKTTSGNSTSVGGVGKTTSELQTPTGYTGIYADWDNLDLDGDSATTDANFLWDFGSASEYPILTANTAPKILSSFAMPFGPNPSFNLNEDKDDRTTISVGTMKGRDAEGDTFTWALSGSDAASFNLGDTASNRTVKVYVNETTVLDFESGKIEYSLTITATDERWAASSLDFTIKVIDVVEVPPFKPHNAPTVVATSGSTTSLTVTWSAPVSSGSAISGYDVQYREKDATPAATWASHPHSGTGTTATIGSLTASTAYEVQVRGINAAGAGPWSDSGTGTTSAPNSAPVFTDGATTTRSVAENTAATQNIGSAVAATDADAADTLTYTLSGTDAASFGIVSSSGQLQTKASLDYETKTSYTVTVSVSDSKNADGAADTAVDASTTVTISVTNMDEAGSVSFDSTTATVGTALAATITDPDGSVSSITWQWASSSVGSLPPVWGRGAASAGPRRRPTPRSPATSATTCGPAPPTPTPSARARPRLR